MQPKELPVPHHEDDTAAPATPTTEVGYGSPPEVTANDNGECAPALATPTAGVGDGDGSPPAVTPYNNRDDDPGLATPTAGVGDGAGDRSPPAVTPDKNGDDALARSTRTGVGGTPHSTTPALPPCAPMHRVSFVIRFIFS